MKTELLSLFLQAVATVETGGNARAVGAAGERGAFQLTPAVVASCGGYGEREAMKHARWLERQLEDARIAVVPFNLALAWNAGPGNVRRGTAPVRSYEYALRVREIFEELQRKQESRPVAFTIKRL